MSDSTHPEDFDSLDADEFLSKLNRWRDLKGDENGPPEDWSEALELMTEAYNVLRELRTPTEAVVALSDIYAAIVDDALRGQPSG